MKKSVKLLFLIVGLAICVAISSCGTAAVVSIEDDGVTTDLEVKLPRKVVKILWTEQL